ncbi:hypothetical protein ACFY05_12395 [Microtetraspora fusca]|uniref:Glycosyltransferase RgtA/B/C/D-like domain-containing protein n=1 Tax=Microtetraspora fusca TaxID=1997 RepID=A0ABW6V2V3_MICFU
MRSLLRHRLFVVLFVLALALRVLAMVAFSPAVWFDDSFEYVGVAERMQPYPVRPSGYSLLLWLMRPLHSFGAVVAVQHLMGLATGAMVYALLRRRLSGARPVWAVLAAAPVLFDAYQIFFEHAVLSDVLFAFLVTASVTVVLWSPRVSPGRAAAAAALLAAATLTRSIGLMLLPLLAGHLLLTRSGRRALLVAAVALAVPLGGYAAWYASWHGSPGLNGGSGVWLWARTMPFADCARIRPPADEAVLCPEQPLGSRRGSPHYIWSDWSPLRKVPGRPVVTRADLFQPGIDDLAGRFARRAVAAQPLDYLGLVAVDLGRTTGWRRGPSPGTVPIAYNRYAFPNVTRPLPDDVRIPGGSIHEDLWAYERGRAATRFTDPAAPLVRAYQTYVFLPGTVFGALVVAAMVAYGAAVAVRARRAAAVPAALPLAAGLALVVAPVVVAAYDSRYWLPAVPLLCLALALVALGRTGGGVRSPAAARPPAVAHVSG